MKNQLTALRQRFWVGLGVSSYLSLMMISPAAIAQETMLKTLTVTGQGVERIPTTLTQVQLGVEIQGTNAAQVQREVAQRTQAVVDLLRSRQVQRLETTGLQLQPNYQYKDNQRNLVGYIGTNTVSFRLPTEQVGALLDETVKVGATRIDGISFTATDEAIAIAQKAALRQATEDAQQQGQVVLQSLNLTPQDIVSIQINGADIPSPKPFQTELRSAQALNADVSMPVIGGEQTVRASVTLQMSY